MGTTKRLRTKDEELAYKRIMVATAELATKEWGESLDVDLPDSVLYGDPSRAGQIAKMVSDDIKRMAKVPL